MIFIVERESKSPVGSSKRIIDGEFARDLAIALILYNIIHSLLLSS